MSWNSLFPLELVLHILDHATPELTIHLACTCKKLYSHKKIDERFNSKFNKIVQKITCLRTGGDLNHNPLVLNASEFGRLRYLTIMRYIRRSKKAMDKEMLGRLAWSIAEHPLTLTAQSYSGAAAAYFIGYLAGIRSDTMTASLPILCVSALVFSRPLGEIAELNLNTARNFCSTLMLPSVLFARLFNVWSGNYSIWFFHLMETLAGLFATRNAWMANIKRVWSAWNERSAHRVYVAAKKYHADMVVPWE